jgi:hypothetical protein
MTALPSASAPGWVCVVRWQSGVALREKSRRREQWKNKPDSGFKEREMKNECDADPLA